MFDYFTEDPDFDLISYSVRRDPRLTRLKRQYAINISKILKYYGESSKSTDNDNMLVSLIKSLIPNLELDVYTFHKHVATNAVFVSKQFGIVSNLSQGRVLESVVDLRSENEIFLYVDRSESPTEYADHYATGTSLRYIYHDSSDISLALPDTHKSYGLGYYIYEINIIGMCMQYYYWVKHRAIVDTDTSVNGYVATVVIPNTIQSYLGLSTYNRFINISNDVVNTSTTNQYPFSLLSTTKEFDIILKSSCEYLKKSPMELPRYLRHVPSVGNVSVINSLYLNHEIFTSQSRWVLWLSRIHTIYDVLNLLGGVGIRMNQKYTRVIKYELIEFKRSESKLKDLLPHYIHSELYTTLNLIKRMV